MTTVLGIHCGHEASCAVVRDGVVVAAIQQERVTRTKYDGQECLSNRLPVLEVLAAAGTSLADVDVIVSSFQAAGPSAVGLQRPLFTSDFDRFDPFDERHFAVSHHVAHAACTAGLSGFASAAVLVSDSAGTSSRDGRDFHEPFGDFFARYTADDTDTALFTEMRSVYRFTSGRFELLARDFAAPHNQPDVHVQGEASLYDNVARFLFRKEHAHGQLMALGGIPFTGPPRLSTADIVESGTPPRVRNGWQRLRAHADPVADADIASVVQDAFTELVVHQAERAVGLAGERRICCAGGVFLNLTGNTAIAGLDGVDDVYVPSCPHDAGISIGAAFLGYYRHVSEPAVRGRVRSDFLGRHADEIDVELAARYGFAEAVSTEKLLHEAAQTLVGGAIIARYAGRAEFGPRALGNRSILCHPVGCRDARSRLNTVKGRQWWRPVAPIVRVEDVDTYFTGPAESPFMNFNFTVREEYRDPLAEALHLDGTARVQTVTAADNPVIHRLLGRVADLGALPVLINTSLNGPGEPILESADEVLRFVRRTAVDHLLTDARLFVPPDVPDLVEVRPRPGAALAAFGSGRDRKYLLSDVDTAESIDRDLFLALCGEQAVTVDRHEHHVAKLIETGLLVEH
ncbi:carbamoyltransferase C-terminal domain-containing protein [Actinophytocola oryzae]|uniref:Carbamoyltransferase n=1 Tax=Actinophytocola oryzae TaxID=502181 RepID=A0A4R7W6B7_9PSEU|nr:carbamoyltransferase C-terminal domain-containing protein [Actinophytocola oryzae]TDV57698.1 carbamoyltransferase [Actinophytocola oryzae]